MASRSDASLEAQLQDLTAMLSCQTILYINMEKNLGFVTTAWQTQISLNAGLMKSISKLKVDIARKDRLIMKLRSKILELSQDIEYLTDALKQNYTRM